MDLRLAGLYVGPDQMMPVATILATIMGFLLIFWNKLLGVIRKVFRLAPPQDAPDSPAAPPQAEEPRKTPDSK